LQAKRHEIAFLLYYEKNEDISERSMFVAVVGCSEATVQGSSCEHDRR